MLRWPGWTCNGRGLSIVMMAGDLPVVCPTDRLGELDEPTAYIMNRDGGPRPFTGSDHMHLVLGSEPDRAPPEDVE